MSQQDQIHALLAGVFLLCVVLGLQAYQMDRMRASVQHATEQVREARKSLQEFQHRLETFESRLDAEATEVARVLVSETSRPSEMPYIAWVVRHRFKTGYGGATSYRDVVRQPWQFTGLSRASSRQELHLGPARALRRHYGDRWIAAKEIAIDTLLSRRGSGPFGGRRVLHFYSPRSMPERYPSWIARMRPVASSLDSHRFTFLDHHDS